jgi:hypothetical protein
MCDAMRSKPRRKMPMIQPFRNLPDGYLTPEEADYEPKDYPWEENNKT